MAFNLTFVILSFFSTLQDTSLSADSANNPGYLVLMKCSASTNGSADDACIGWTGDTIYVKPTAETTISLSQIEVRSGARIKVSTVIHWNLFPLSCPARFSMVLYFNPS